MNLLNREQLLKRQELKIEKVQLDPENFVFVRQMTGREKDQYEKLIFKTIGEGENMKLQSSFDDYRAKLAVQVLCDEKGDNLLKPNDYETLSKNMSSEWLEKIVTVANRLNGMGEKNVESMIKN